MILIRLYNIRRLGRRACLLNTTRLIYRFGAVYWRWCMGPDFEKGKWPNSSGVRRFHCFINMEIALSRAIIGLFHFLTWMQNSDIKWKRTVSVASWALFFTPTNMNSFPLGTFDMSIFVSKHWPNYTSIRQVRRIEVWLFSWTLPRLLTVSFGMRWIWSSNILDWAKVLPLD